MSHYFNISNKGLKLQSDLNNESIKCCSVNTKYCYWFQYVSIQVTRSTAACACKSRRPIFH
jgi:hypothetical protein